MSKLTSKNVLIVGGSSGIGAALADAYAAAVQLPEESDQGRAVYICGSR